MQILVSVDPQGLSLKIKEQARAAGFEKIGIVPAEALQIEGGRLRKWLSQGYRGEMTWMSRDPDQRADPRAFFPRLVQ